MSVLVAVLLSCAAACGDDDVVARIGHAEEGEPCDAKSACLTGLNCVMNVFTVGICARPCSDESSCETDERCFSYTDSDADKHCVNLVTDEYDLCGVAVTGVCQDRSCLYFPDLPIGVCVDICAVGSQSGDAGVPGDAGISGDDDDGGVSSSGGGQGLAMCRPSETCIEGVVDSPRAGEGVCGTQVERGDECGIERGLYCVSGDRCLIEDPKDENSKLRCYQDCSAGNKCDKGKCVLLGDMFARCS